MSRETHRHPRAMPLRLLVTTTLLFVLHSSEVHATVTDRFPAIPNAYATTSTDVTVRAVFDAAQLTTPSAAAVTTSVEGNSLSALRSSGYVLCQPQTATPDTSTAAIVSAWCSTNDLNSAYWGTYVTQSVNWSTLAPPGLQLLDASAESYRARAWDCLTYACDTENTIDTTTHTAPAAIGGLGVAAPCCGSTNSTFVLYNTRGIIVQASDLPVAALNREALLLAEADAAAFAAASASSSLASPPAAPDLTNAMDFCLVRQLLPSFTENTIVHDNPDSVGDGAVFLPVEVAVCGNDVSDRIDPRHATLAVRGYTLILTTADGVDEMAFPKELINSIGAWIAYKAGTAAGSYGADKSLARADGICAWHYEAAYATAYRTGDYYDCAVSDPALLAHLPPLMLSIRNDSIVDTEETNSSCSIALDLTACVVANGASLRFFSSGSIASQLQLHENSMAQFHDPPLVVGMRQLRGATIAVTRSALVDKWASAGYYLSAGLPLLYLAVPRGTAMASALASTSWPACVQAQTCQKRQIFYPSLNRCATKECLNVLLYHFDPETFACSVRVSIVSLFAAMCFGVVAAEVLVLYLRRSTEEAKEEHVRLVHAVQRKGAGTQ